jgi:hypothetical protein
MSIDTLTCVGCKSDNYIVVDIATNIAMSMLTTTAIITTTQTLFSMVISSSNQTDDNYNNSLYQSSSNDVRWPVSYKPSLVSFDSYYMKEFADESITF